MKKSLIFSGSGGQGVVSAGVMTAKAAVDAMGEDTTIRLEANIEDYHTAQEYRN